MSGGSDPDVVLRAAALSKVFTVYNKPSDVLARLFRRQADFRELWALRDVSFELRRGEVLGLVGRNGAGKSTLLKILAGTLTPSGGTVEISGRVSAILELGTGFHADFSGRENIYLGGLCLGLTRAEIDARVDEIIDFSELREVIDQPFKTYSTGMQARLTFSTVASIEPDLLIVDEALSVGDARFQLRSFGKFQEFRRNGRTIILVSHNMNTITGFCDRAILLDKGQMLLDSDPSTVSTFYHRLLFGDGDKADEGHKSAEADLSTSTASTGGQRAPDLQIDRDSAEYRFGTKAAEIVDFGILDTDGHRCSLLVSGNSYRFYMHIAAHCPVANSCAGFVVRSARGVELFGTDTTCVEGFPDLPLAAAGDLLEVTIEVTMWLGPGEYFLSFAVADRSGIKLDCRFDALYFTVVGAPTLHTTSIVNLSPSFRMQPLSRRGAAADPALVVEMP